MISFEDFAKLELKIGTILEAEEVEGSEKLIKCMVDLGPAPDGAGYNPELNSAGQDIRQILAGVKQWYKAEDLVGKQVVVVANLEPRMMMGLESQGMLLAADPSTTLRTGSKKPIFLKPSSKVPPGTKVR